MKPGTALPWYTAKTGNHQGLVISERDGENVAVTYNGDGDAAYIVHACNAYPRLVEALGELVGIQSAAADRVNNLEHLRDLEALLRECEE